MSSSTNDLQPKEPTHMAYGDLQGSFRGVNIWSNRDDGFFSGENNYVDYVVYTGYRYQCVEFARRFLLLTTGCTFASCGRACEIFDMKTIQNVETGAIFDLVPHHNGRSPRRPQPGDLIVYPYHKEYFPWGHVGIISYVGDEKVGVAEQNHSFTRLFSPNPEYLNGECCVGRYISLQMTDDGNWLLHSPDDGVDCLGWMSYLGAPTRQVIHALLKPLPELMSVRSTPVDSDGHPMLWRCVLPGPDPPLNAVYALRCGSGEALVGSATALARIVRFTLQFIFRCGHLSHAFVALPTNPLGAELVEVSPELDALMAVAANDESTDDAMDESLAAHFALPPYVIAAMRREFRLTDAYMIAHANFWFNTAAVRPTSLPGGVEAREIRAGITHDEAWGIETVDFGTPKFLRHLAKQGEAKKACVEFMRSAIAVDNATCFMTSHEWRVDFSRYVKYVEELRGPRNAFTIIADTVALENAEVKSVITVLSEFCDQFKYPVCVVDEAHVSYEGSKLYAKTSTGYRVHVDFCFCVTEWADILAATPPPPGESPPVGRAALREAAMDPKGDIVFAKPLWTYLCSGPVFTKGGKKEEEVVEDNSGESGSLGSKFYDICRRLYEYAAPKQPPELWAGDVHEFKDSCRRIHMAASLEHACQAQEMEGETGGLRTGAGMVNFAASCFTAQEADGETSGLMYVFLP